MKLISTDFSNLDKKTIYDFGDDEAIDELMKVRKSNRECITRNFFDIADTPVRFRWMRDLALILQSVDSNAKKNCSKRPIKKICNAEVGCDNSSNIRIFFVFFRRYRSKVLFAYDEISLNEDMLYENSVSQTLASNGHKHSQELLISEMQKYVGCAVRCVMD